MKQSWLMSKQNLTQVKHILASLLYLCTTATITPIFAQNEGDSGPLHWVFTLADSTLTISGEGAMPDYSTAPWGHLQSSIKYAVIETGVTTVGINAFAYCNALASATISNTVTTIRDYAFYECTSLISATIPNSVIDIWDYSFDNCISLISANIPNSVKTIGGYAFNNCHSLTELTIPNSVTTIGGYAFNSCTSLISVTIPDSIKIIRNSSFGSCTSLTTIIIPNSTTTIEDYAFAYCTSLTTVINHAAIPQIINNKVFQSVNIAPCTLYVPDSYSVNLYDTTDIWEYFHIILPVGESSTVTYNSPANGALDVTANGETVANGSTVAFGTPLTITATAAEGYKLTALMVNGVDFTSGTTHIVTSNITIECSFELLGIEENVLPDITVYGNANNVHIKNENSILLKAIQIMDITGRVVYYSDTVDSGFTHAQTAAIIPVENANGIYIVRLILENQKVSVTKVFLSNN